MDDESQVSDESRPQGTPWYARSGEEALAEFDVQADKGLPSSEAQKRLKKHGPNQLQKAETRAWWRILLDQLQSIVVYLLGAAAVLAFATQRWAEGMAVVAVIGVNTAIGFVSEWKAVRSMAALRKLGEHKARVRRDGEEHEIEARDIVPGDIVLVDAGELVPADLRLIEAKRLRVSEAPLTGESVPVDKTTSVLEEEEIDLAERQNMLYKGTSIADGKGVGVAVGTGIHTELGHISELAEKAEATVTPLQKRLNKLGQRLAWITIGIAVCVAGIGLLVRHQEAQLVIETALALGIAAIPEGLPIVATIALARGMYLMAKRNALVNRLTAVETLGATRVIFSDKTGTLTENHMRLQKIVTPAGEQTLEESTSEQEQKRNGLMRQVVEVGILCNSASLEGTKGDGQPSGDPTEVALLAAGQKLGIERKQLLEAKPEVRMEEFDPRTKKMATFHEQGHGIYVAVKGAPEAVLEVCNRIASEHPQDDEGDPLDEEQRQDLLAKAEEVAAEGLRLLAMADKRVDSKDTEPYQDLRFLGIVGLMDPPREGVKAAIDICQSAGIRVEMVTGDKPETAKAIAGLVGMVGEADDPEAIVVRGSELKDPEELDDSQKENIYKANIFARVSPEQKLNLVRLYQNRGEVVAMTGDGVNDAPALKKADIGVAMGKRGQEAAKQVADMVLQDDAFETIVAAVEQGRVIFNNIRKSALFMLCTNVAEVLAVTVATLVGWTLPLHPLQILYLNVLTDVFPALALGIGPGTGFEMDKPPRDPKESILNRRSWIEIAGWAVLIGACVLTSLLLAQHWLGMKEMEAVTISFLTLAFGKLWFTFNLRNPRSNVFKNEITRNPWIWAAIGLCIALLIAAVYLPGLSDVLQTRPPGRNGWALLLGMSVIPLLVGQIVREVQRHRAEKG